jgi:hypothetical protein
MCNGAAKITSKANQMLIAFDKTQLDRLQYRSAETTIEDLAKKLDTLTAPDKIDMNVAQFGNRVAIVEIRERPDLNRVEARACELTIGQFRRMIRKQGGTPPGLLGSSVTPDAGAPAAPPKTVVSG